MPHELHGKCGRRASRRVDGQCHRKQTACSTAARRLAQARVKRWGKSPPRRRQRRRHEKPLPVQGKIGGWTARPIATGMLHSPASAQAGEGGRARRKAGLREMTAEPRPVRGEQNPAYRPQSQIPGGRRRFRAGRAGPAANQCGSASMAAFCASYWACVSSWKRTRRALSRIGSSGRSWFTVRSDSCRPQKRPGAL